MSVITVHEKKAQQKKSDGETNLQDLNGILDDAKRAQITCGKDVGNVPVNKNLSG